MKKIAIIGVIALVVIGCVLAAGCTSTTNNGANPASGMVTDLIMEGQQDGLVLDSGAIVVGAAKEDIGRSIIRGALDPASGAIILDVVKDGFHGLMERSVLDPASGTIVMGAAKDGYVVGIIQNR